MKSAFKSPAALALGALLATTAHAADPAMEPAVADLAHRWAAINYHAPAKAQETAFHALADQAGKLVAAEPGHAQPLVWEAIVLASYAKANGGIGALSAARQARDLLLAAEKIDPSVLNGSVYTSLGSLYAKVPGWPLGFGDKDKAGQYFDKALAINPDGIDSNYLYADYLAGRGDYAGAARHLQQALAAPPRPGREDADAGRRQEAQALLDELRHKHGGALAAQ